MLNEIANNVISFLLHNIESNKNIATLTTMSLTIVGLSVTLAISPYQSVSKSVSSSVYELIIKNNNAIRFLITNYVLSVVQILILLFGPLFKITELMSCVFLLFILLNALLSFFYTRRMLDSYYFSIPLIENEIIRTMLSLRKFVKQYNQNDLFRLYSLQTKISQVMMLGRESHDESQQFYPEDLLKVIKYKFNILQEVIDNSIKNEQYGSFEKGIEALGRCLNKYFSEIEGYYVSMDEFFLNLLEYVSNTCVTLSTKKNAYIYYQMLIGKIFNVVRENIDKNVDSDFYLSNTLRTYFSIVNNSQKEEAYFDKITIINSLLDMFQKGKRINAVCVVSDSMINILSDKHKIENELIHSAINRIIHTFIYYNMKNERILEYQDYYLDKILILGNNINAKNILTPMLGNDDYTTQLSTDYSEDKTISSSINILIYNQIIKNSDGVIPIKLFNLIESLTDISISVLHKGGVHISGVVEQLYRIFYELFLLIEGESFKLFYSTTYCIELKKIEKTKIQNIMNKILFHIISMVGKINFHDMGSIIYSCIKIKIAEIKAGHLKYESYRQFIPFIYTRIFCNRRIDLEDKKLVLKLLNDIKEEPFQKKARDKIEELEKSQSRYFHYSYIDVDSSYLHQIPINGYIISMEKVKNRINTLISKPLENA